jgi:N-methylhydantoinase A
MTDPAPDLYVGVDTGGTFTDLAVMDADGQISTTKAATTPHALEEGVLAALELAAQERGQSLDAFLARVASFGHGTTQATNALIERKGARTSLITTRGFGDTLIIQRLMGFSAGTPSDQLGWYSRRRYPDPIVPRDRVHEVAERVDQAGRILLALDRDEARRTVEAIVADGAEAIAVSLLWSFRNDEHEQAIGEIVREIAGDGVFLSLSSEVSPVIGEYERTAATVLNSYLGPTVDRYLGRLERTLREHGLPGSFTVLNSIGGVMSAEEAAARAVLLLSSGPSGGVIGSRYLAEALQQRNVITSDMGGTSFDVGLVIDGRPVVSGVTEVAKYHVSAPMIDIRAVGAGGGSIASVQDGLIRVGPESAGASPGPVCYGQGGERPTVTDANLVLGIIDADTFLGGRMRLDRDAAVRAIEEHIAVPLGIDALEAAAGIRRIVNSHMADTLRELTIGRGHDPRDFVLYAYGGAGPMHCGGYGAELGVDHIVVPSTSMVQSAYGALASDLHHSAERSFLLRGGGGPAEPWEGIDVEELARQFERLEQRCRDAMAANRVADEDLSLARSVDVRYRSQTHELIVPVAAGTIDEALVRGLTTTFEETYEATYGKGAGFREAGIEITTFRVDAVGRRRKPAIAPFTADAGAGAGTRNVYDAEAGGWSDAAVVPWSGLVPGAALAGPAVVQHATTTVYVERGQDVRVDATGNLIITVLERSAA